MGWVWGECCCWGGGIERHHEGSNWTHTVPVGGRLPRPIISRDDGMEVILSLVGLLLNDGGGD